MYCGATPARQILYKYADQTRKQARTHVWRRRRKT